jgi:peptidoglycan/xylan/chitin deacetylase (PgdA/CDA1 family)
MVDSAVIRGPKSTKRIALVFTGHEFAEGAEVILTQLAKHQAKASFFLTGDFLANTNHAPFVRRMLKDAHYLGPHSDKHILYCPWDGPKKTLVSHQEFESDLHKNLAKLRSFGVKPSALRYFLPPYEHYNQEIAIWSKKMGITLVNYTPGTRSNADYTEEADKNFVSSKIILNSIFSTEQQDPHGLNGFLLLLHLGSGPARTDKFHVHFAALLDYLSSKGYQLVRVDELLE